MSETILNKILEEIAGVRAEIMDTNRNVDTLRSEVTALTGSLDPRVTAVEQGLDRIHEDLTRQNQRLAFLEKKERENNIIFFGLPPSCKSKSDLLEVLGASGAALQERDIDQFLLLGKSTNGPALVKCSNRSTRCLILDTRGKLPPSIQMKPDLPPDARNAKREQLLTQLVEFHSNRGLNVGHLNKRLTLDGAPVDNVKFSELFKTMDDARRRNKAESPKSAASSPPAPMQFNVGGIVTHRAGALTGSGSENRPRSLVTAASGSKSKKSPKNTPTTTKAIKPSNNSLPKHQQQLTAFQNVIPSPSRSNVGVFDVFQQDSKKLCEGARKSNRNVKPATQSKQ